jgi:hypothetical protein
VVARPTQRKHLRLRCVRILINTEVIASPRALLKVSLVVMSCAFGTSFFIAVVLHLAIGRRGGSWIEQ